MLASRRIAAAVSRSLPARGSRLAAPHMLRRGYSSAEAPKKSGNGLIFALALIGAGAGIAYYANSVPSSTTSGAKSTTKAASAPVKDYQAVYNAIAAALEAPDTYDDGSYAPVLLRLAWHAAGTYDAATKTGGSDGSTMRFKPESAHDANAGLALARNILESIKVQFPWITYADLWSLAGVVAVQELGGPAIPWRAGRSDKLSTTDCTPDGRLPDAAQGASHIRAIFNRMGFNDQEIVALSGAHALGRCHTDRSGFTGPWTFSPTSFNNEFFRLLIEEKWIEKKWKGPKQFTDKTTGTLMMLPTDMELVRDKAFRKWTEIYAKDEDKWRADFAVAFKKLEELGVPFADGSTPILLKPTA